jgi:hypothetical protein
VFAFAWQALLRERGICGNRALACYRGRLDARCIRLFKAAVALSPTEPLACG